MKIASLPSAVVVVAVLSSVVPAGAQTATPTSLSFSYQVNSTTFPAAGKVTVTLPATAGSSTTMTVQTASTPQGWLAVTPSSGHSPLALTVNVNPTGLSPGNYIGTITVTIPAGSSPAVISVNLLISNPPSTLLVSSPSSNWTASPPTFTFSYTTGSGVPLPASAEVDVASSGDIIPFNVTAAVASAKASGSSTAGVWLSINQANQLPTAQTSGVALSGSYVPITVTLDQSSLDTLDPGSYGGSIVVAANSAANGSITISVNLVVSAGAPVLNSIFPASVIAAPVVNPLITIYGDNFFSTSVVSLQQGTNPPITLTSTLLSRQVLTATVAAALLASPTVWTLSVTNPAPPNNPSQAPVSTLFTVTSASQPAITAIVNAASYLPTAVQTGTNPNPVPLNATSISPREIISIFGQNLGPATVTTATPQGDSLGDPPTYPTTLAGIAVIFQIDAQTQVNAPIIMVSSNQINAIVPVATANVLQSGNPFVSVTVQNGVNSTQVFPLTVVTEDPGMFTFGGLGQGQAAILNYDNTTGAYTINSSTVPAPRGSTILIYATGMGDLSVPPSGLPLADGAVASSALPVADGTVRVDISGQPAVVSYAGASPGAVAGLVQINAIVPPTVAAGKAVPITVSIGSAATARRSQPGATLSIK